jgi:DNA-nicking Smr family endonuclease
MQKDNKNNSIIEDDDLWESITKNDKKYIKANRHVYEKLNSEKKINIIVNQKNPLVTNNQVNKNNIKTGSMPVNKNRKIQELDPKKVPSGISASQAEKLKKGKIRPERTIDLHGFTQFRAHSYINDEIIKCYKNNIRSILIITGKKFGKMGAEGVLKKEVPKWLNLSPLKEVILMTSWATPRDGGEGALYVLLRRVR